MINKLFLQINSCVFIVRLYIVHLRDDAVVNDLGLGSDDE
jgi:hypothetical protein